MTRRKIGRHFVNAKCGESEGDDGDVEDDDDEVRRQRTNIVIGTDFWGKRNS